MRPETEYSKIFWMQRDSPGEGFPTVLNNIAIQPEFLVHNVGINGNIVTSIPVTLPGKTDEDFFQLMCHVEPSLRVKIKNGEFVDLEKLLLKDR